MKNILLACFVLAFSNASFAQFNGKEIDNTLVKISDQLLASKFEVSNKLYTAFLNDLKKSNNKNVFAIAQIDSSQWRDKSSYNEPYVKYYHTHQAYTNFPVVNISYEAAQAYCKWLTEQYNNNPNRKYKKVLFRLPSENEWVSAAQAGNSAAIYAWKGNGLENKEGKVLCNFIREPNNKMTLKSQSTQNSDITAPVNSYWENGFGLYNMCGNVAEMTTEKDITKGGSWKDNAEGVKIQSKLSYDGKAHANVGFRYFADVIEK